MAIFDPRSGHGSGERTRADPAADRSETARRSDLRARQEALLDEGVEETFPASDPVAVVRLI